MREAILLARLADAAWDVDDNGHSHDERCGRCGEDVAVGAHDSGCPDRDMGLDEIEALAAYAAENLDDGTTLILLENGPFPRQGMSHVQAIVSPTESTKPMPSTHIVFGATTSAGGAS